jgi:predicted amidohydrolase YtcJ
VGKQADLVVFDRDPFLDGGFGDTRAAMTVAGGKVVYQADNASPEV